MEYDTDEAGQLLWVLHGYCESEGLDTDYYTPDDTLESLWDDYISEVGEVLTAVFGEEAAASLMEHNETYPLDVYHTLIGAGVDIQDGRWADIGVNPTDAETESVKKQLKQWADIAGGGAIAEAVHECVHHRD